jgi:LuxR family transcriptional regulator, maltose regulon positive regulatory protein
VPETTRDPRNLVAATKYRVPRARRSCILRERLVGRLAAAASEVAVVAVIAPAGYGKTTLLTQYANSVALPTRVVWFSVDADDDDVARFFASLVSVLEPLDLEWRLPPRELVANMSAAPQQVRAVAGELAAALESAAENRYVVVLDDLHRVASADIALLLEALIERLPEHVTLVLASRTPLPLPMARWVVSGEAIEIGPRDLEFSSRDAEDLTVGTGESPDAARHVREVLERTHGWPAAAALMLRAASSGDPLESGAVSEELLYDYLASEVLHRLPSEMQQFLLDVAVLAELTPELCGALADCTDSRAMLRALYRQDLFVTAVDGSIPVLRLHDLFRDFLQARLAATAPDRLRQLHERAARAEPSLPRAVGHYLAARQWRPALQLIARNADVLREQGHQQSMQRWLDQVPDEVVAETEEGLYVRACCAWLRWDWIQSRADMSRLIERMRAAGREPPTDALLSMMGFLSAVGEREEAARVAAAVAARPLGPKDRAVLSLRQAWASMDTGDLEAVAGHFGEFVGLAAENPREIAPLIVDRTSPYIGLPGMLAQYERFLGIARTAMGSGAALWHGAYWVIEGWVELWRGRRDVAEQAIGAARELQSRFGGVTPTEDALARLEAVFLAATGRGGEGVRLARTLVERFASPRYASIKVVFERAYWAGLGKVAWMSGDGAAVREAAQRLLPPTRPQEWLFIDLVRPTLQAQVAMLDGRWEEAERQLKLALRIFERVRFPQGHADPRVLAVCVQRMLGRREGAWSHLEPVLAECLAGDAIGPLACEPAWVTDAALEVIPSDRRADPHLQALLRRLDAWRSRPSVPAVAGPLAKLTEREREVLARVAMGDGNKDIARRLDLSLHTVKRHIANILGKLDCVSRRQAGDLYRQHVG